MNIFVTGGCGFVGSNLVRLLVNSGHQVVNMDKVTYAGNVESLADIADHPNYTFLKADICDHGALKNAFALCPPDAVMHLAAESHVDRSIDGPGEFVTTNVLGTYSMLQAALTHYRRLSGPAKTAFRFLHVSTDEVYGALEFDDPPFSETSPYDPRSPYSASKAASDHLARAWHTTYGLPVIVTNSCNNYGPHQFPEKLIPVTILKCLRGEHVPVYGNGEHIRDWLHVVDHCEALVRVVTDGIPGETYNVGGNNERSNLEVVKSLCKLLDELRPKSDIGSYETLIELVADRPGHDRRYAIDASKIRRELGWRPTKDLESGFRGTVIWYLDNVPWWERILSGAYRLDRQGLSGP